MQANCEHHYTFQQKKELTTILLKNRFIRFKINRTETVRVIEGDDWVFSELNLYIKFTPFHYP